MRRRGTLRFVATVTFVVTAASSGCDGATSDDGNPGGESTGGTADDPLPTHFDCVCPGSNVPPFATQDFAECLERCASYEHEVCPSFLGLNSCPKPMFTTESETKKDGSPCLVLLDDELGNPNDVNVALDCEVIPGYEMGGAGGADGGWMLDTSSRPMTLELWGYACEQVKAAARIDILMGCSGPL